MNKKILLIVISMLFLVSGFIVGKSLKIQKNEIVLKDNEFILNDIGIIEVNKENDEQFTQNIQPIKFSYVSKINTLDKKILMYAVNNNEKVTAVEVEVDFYDENGYAIDLKTQSGIIMPKTPFIITIEYLDNSTYKTYKVKYKAYEISSKYNDVKIQDNIELSSVKTNNNDIIVSFKNKNNFKIDKIFISCILYNDKEIVDIVSVDSENISFNKGNTLTCVPNNNLIYNDYKIYISQMYDLGSDANE